MTLFSRVRRHAPVLTLVVMALALGACGGDYPNSTFNHHTDLNTDIDSLWDKLLLWGTIVFVIVEAILIYTIVKFRKRPNSPPIQMTHGNTAMEISWTVLPIVILVIIAVPTVKTIFKTQAKAPQGSLEVEVVGHQWWWEFKYPQYGFSTANELYLPVGKTVNFTLHTQDVLHAFWVPQLGGKRDLISTRTNYLWYTPNSDIADQVWNGFCTEYCGSSHANMRIRAYTVTPPEFDQWVAGQKAPAIFNPAAAPAAPAGASKGMASAAPTNGNTTTASAGVLASQSAPPQKAAAPQQKAGAAQPAAAAQTPAPAPTPGWFFPAEKLPAYVVPKTPVPAGLEYDDALLANGDAARGQAAIKAKSNICMSCHTFEPQPMMQMPTTGPNLAHVATRHTIAGGLYPNDAHHLARWIKNAPRMKPGSKMIVFGAGQTDPITGKGPPMGSFTDQEIADIVAYLRALK